MIEAEAIDQALAMSGGLVSFEGQNCNDYLSEGEAECSGWDGESRRCECGNRRVSWEVYRDDSGDGVSVAAVAW